jgi:hypothetical protein
MNFATACGAIVRTGEPVLTCAEISARFASFTSCVTAAHVRRTPDAAKGFAGLLNTSLVLLDSNQKWRNQRNVCDLTGNGTGGQVLVAAPEVYESLFIFAFLLFLFSMKN